MLILKSEKVTLRRPCIDDLKHFKKWASDPFLDQMVNSHLLYSFRYNYKNKKKFIEELNADKTQLALMINANSISGHTIGLVRLFDMNLLNGYAFLETIVGDRRYLLKGWGTEASCLLIHHGMQALGLRRVEAKVFEYNRLSINSLLKNGFKLEGVLRKAFSNNGKYWDILVFGIIDSELEEQRSKLALLDAAFQKSEEVNYNL